MGALHLSIDEKRPYLILTFVASQTQTTNDILREILVAVKDLKSSLHVITSKTSVSEDDGKLIADVRSLLTGVCSVHSAVYGTITSISKHLALSSTTARRAR